MLANIFHCDVINKCVRLVQDIMVNLLLNLVYESNVIAQSTLLATVRHSTFLIFYRSITKEPFSKYASFTKKSGRSFVFTIQSNFSHSICIDWKKWIRDNGVERHNMVSPFNNVLS